MKYLSLSLFLSITIWSCHQKAPDLIHQDRYLAGLTLSRAMNKPLFVFFTCYGCMGYNAFDLHLRESTNLMAFLNKYFVNVLLYVDDRAPLIPQDTVSLSKLSLSSTNYKLLSKAANVGRFNSGLQEILFQSSTQPTYLFLDPEGQLLTPPLGYTGKRSILLLEQAKLALRAFQEQE